MLIGPKHLARQTEGVSNLNLELQVEAMVRDLNSQIAPIGEEFKQIRRASDYASRVATVTRKVLSSPKQQGLWLEQLGLIQCFFVVPSELFASPVTCVFSVPEWEPQDWIEVVGQFGEGIDRISFFDNLLIPYPLLHIHFSGSGIPPQKAPRSRGIKNLEVCDDFFDFLDDWLGDDEIPNSLDEDDTRLITFRECNWHFAPFFNHRGKATWDMRSLDDLQSLRPPAGAHRHLFRIGQLGHGADSAVFAFVFSNAIRPRHRILLRLFSHLILDLFRTRDRVELHHRIVKYRLTDEVAQLAIHDARNLIGTLNNELRSAYVAHQKKDHTSVEIGLSTALQVHSDLATFLGNFEHNASSHADCIDRIFSLKSLHNLWKQMWPVGPYRETHIDSRYDDILFQLPGPPDPLGRALYNFLDFDTPPPDQWVVTPELLDPVFYKIDMTNSILKITGRSPSLLTAEVEEALHSVSTDQRLPSAKPGGGEGLFGAINVIRNEFAGQVQFGNNNHLGFTWEVAIPIHILRQYNLFVPQL